MSILDPSSGPTVPTVFVPHRVLRRVIKQHAGLGGLGLRVPHDECLALPVGRLRRLRDGAGIPVPAGASQVVLVPEPDPVVRAALGPDEALRRMWRLLYHAHLDAHLNERVPDHAEKLVLERIHAIGQTEFDEIRLVLRQEQRVLPPGGDAAVYREFAALFLELRAFAPHLVDHTFPILERPAAVEALLALDVDAEALLEATRPVGAPSSPRSPDAPDPEPLDAEDLDAEPLVAPTAPRLGGAPQPWSRPLATAPVRNLVREAISARRHGEDGDDALRTLATAIHVAVGPTGPSPAEWARALRPALERCGRTLRSETRLLFDVQTAAHEHAKDVYTADLVGWALSRGRRPIARPLPVQRRFRVLRALHRAQRRVPSLGLPAADGQRLSRAMDMAVSACEAGIREELRPRLLAALDEVGLVPRNLPERVAQAKMLDELLDRLIARGFLHLGDVRDAISRNQLKLRDLSGAREAWTGDAMLRLNRRLEDELDGVYRGAEIYLRGMQRLSSLAFGTPAGRTVTLFGLLPFGGAFVILEGLQHMIGPALGWLTGTEPRLSSPTRLLSLGLFLVVLIHSPHARDAARWLLSLTGRVLRWSLIDTPRWVVSLPPVQRVLKSRPVRLLVRRLLRPLLLAALLWWVFPAAGASWLASGLAGIALFGAFNVLLNSRWGRVLEEATADAVIVAWERLRHAILPGLFRLVLDVFERLLSELERVLYAVDEQLRFREGQGRAAFIAKAGGGVVWFGATWIVRLCVNVLVEPQINPIKHFPVVTVSHKVMLGLIPMFAQWVSPLFDGDMKEATIFVGSVVWLIPGAFGYLAWELKENWRLFAANRPSTLRPARIGGHGETLLRLMRPGFHSGTLPKLFARLRRADRGLRGQRDTKAILKAQADLHHVEEAVRAFVERELVALLRASGALAGRSMHVGRVRLASNRIRVELILDGEPETALIGFEEQSGRVVANVARGGFLGALPSPERFARALAGLYALCGVDLVREQVALALPPGARYDIADGGLLVWLHGDVVPWSYDLRRRRMVPRRPGARGGPPALEARQVRFGATPIRWDDWVDAWEGAHDPVPVHGPVLPRARVAARLRGPAAGGSC
ncbi:MAG: hypothetical protein AMXMBFR64_62510 [Myxococcales bacterium]